MVAARVSALGDFLRAFVSCSFSVFHQFRALHPAKVWPSVVYFLLRVDCGCYRVRLDK